MQGGGLRSLRAHGVNDNHLAWGFPQPVFVCMGSRGRGIRPPHHDAGGVSRRARIETHQRRAVQIR